MTTKKNIQEEYKEKLSTKKEDLKKAVTEWTDEDFRKHLENAMQEYQHSKSGNLLGDFSFDPSNVYYWHVRDRNDASRLNRRLKLGWGFATREDAKKAGLTDEGITELTIDGETCVEMSHKSSRAVLLKIPVQLYELNLLARERVRNNRPFVGVDGKQVKTHEENHLDQVIRHQEEQMITFDK